MFMGLRLRRTLGNYDIESAVHSRLLSGIVEVDVPTYQLTSLPREQDDYWNTNALTGAKHGASWHTLTWTRRPIDEKTLQIHFSDRIQLPEASIVFSELINQLGDLGLQTNEPGFQELAQKGLHVLPGTCLVEEIFMKGGKKVATPILVVAKPTIEHPGSLLLRFQNVPSKSVRTKGDLPPCWIRIPPYGIGGSPESNAKNVESSTTVHKKPGQDKPTPESVSGRFKYDTMPAVSPAIEGTSEKLDAEEPEAQMTGPVAGDIEQPTTAEIKAITRQVDEEHPESDIVEYVRISRKGIVEKRLLSGKKFPVMGLPYFFTYSLLGCTAQDGNPEYNGRPFGYHLRLEVLYFARECFLPIRFWYHDRPRTANRASWYQMYARLLSPAKMAAIPAGWTENSPSRTDRGLTRRFELLIEDNLRFRSAAFRKGRKSALKVAQGSHAELYGDDYLEVPAECFEVTASIWTGPAKIAAQSIFPLSPERVPTSQEICIAASSNSGLAHFISEILVALRKWFEEVGGGEEGKLAFLDEMIPSDYNKVIFMCAMIVLNSIADNAPYLAALGDVEDCVTKWNPVYLC
jgi:hypothetical protein